MAPVFSSGTTPPCTMRVSREISGIQLYDLEEKQRASLSPLEQLEFRWRIYGDEAERAVRLRAIFWASIVFVCRGWSICNVDPFRLMKQSQYTDHKVPNTYQARLLTKNLIELLMYQAELLMLKLSLWFASWRSRRAFREEPPRVDLFLLTTMEAHKIKVKCLHVIFKRPMGKNYEEPSSRLLSNFL